MSEAERIYLDNKKREEREREARIKEDLRLKCKSLPMDHPGVIGGGVVGRLMGVKS